jgi:hypothetical protein
MADADLADKLHLLLRDIGTPGSAGQPVKPLDSSWGAPASMSA